MHGGFTRPLVLNGYGWSPADDVGLGMIRKQAGGTTRLASLTRICRVQWYASVVAMFKGLEKILSGLVPITAGG